MSNEGNARILRAPLRQERIPSPEIHHGEHREHGEKEWAARS